MSLNDGINHVAGRLPESREGFQKEIRRFIRECCSKTFGVLPQLGQAERYANGIKITVIYPQEFTFSERADQGHFIGGLKRYLVDLFTSNECFGEMWTWTGGDLKKKENLIFTAHSGRQIEIGVDSYENYQGNKSYYGRTLSVLLKIPFWKEISKT